MTILLTILATISILFVVLIILGFLIAFATYRFDDLVDEEEIYYLRCDCHNNDESELGEAEFNRYLDDLLESLN